MKNRIAKFHWTPAQRLLFGSKSVRGAAFLRLPPLTGPRQPDSLPRVWWFETLPQAGLAGGSKLRAYRRARSLVGQYRRYAGNGDAYIPFTGPVGILP